MPIYEYECGDCRRVVSRLVLRPSADPNPTCPRCGGSALTRVLSRFATVKSEEARLDALAESADFADIDESDPASVARAMKRMERELGDELGEGLGDLAEEAMAEAGADDGEDLAGDAGSDDL